MTLVYDYVAELKSYVLNSQYSQQINLREHVIQLEAMITAHFSTLTNQKNEIKWLHAAHEQVLYEILRYEK